MPFAKDRIAKKSSGEAGPGKGYTAAPQGQNRRRLDSDLPDVLAQLALGRLGASAVAVQGSREKAQAGTRTPFKVTRFGQEAPGLLRRGPRGPAGAARYG